MNGYNYGMSIEYDIPILEILNIWYSRKKRKYGMSCYDRERTEMQIWMTRRQFSSFQEQCGIHARAGIYAHFSGDRFLFTVFGKEIPFCDYRMALHFDLNRKMHLLPVPSALNVPKHVEIDDELRDQYQN